jgi:hypothetical protein
MFVISLLHGARYSIKKNPTGKDVLPFFLNIRTLSHLYARKKPFFFTNFKLFLFEKLGVQTY